MAKSKHTLLYAGGAGVAGFLAYEMFYKPWRAAHDAALTPPAPATSWFTSTGGGGGGGGGGSSYIPSVTIPSTVGPQPSNLSPGLAIGGPVGTCMYKKGWTQQQCQTRLDRVTTAYRQYTTDLAKMKSGQVAAELNAHLAQLTTAINATIPQYNVALSTGNIGGANQLKLSLDDWNNQIRIINGQLAGIPGEITAYENEIAGFKSQYLALTGLNLA